jgi:hypothetical protein
MTGKGQPMKLRALTAAAVLSSALVACTAVPTTTTSGEVHATRSKALGCKPSAPCNVKIWVECTGTPPACAIRLDHEFVVVLEHARPKITWEIVDPSPHVPESGFKFAAGDKGIVFPPEATGEFTGCTAQGGDRKFSCKDEQSEAQPTAWKYTINLVNERDASVELTLDPWVINM